MTVISPADHDYFRRRLKKAADYCARFPGGIDFKDKTVLDIGCGHGALSIRAARQGAASVTGIDLVPKLVDFARTVVDAEFPDMAGRMDFRVARIEDLDDTRYDIIMSQATLEHVSDPALCLAHARQRLKKGGRFYLGFGPLYRAPYGDHRLLRIPLQKIFPWAHCLGGPQRMIRQYNRRFPGEPVNDLQDLGLNGLSYKAYEEIIRNCGLTVRSYQVNSHPHPAVKVINILRRIPGLREYLSINVYTVLENSG